MRVHARQGQQARPPAHYASMAADDLHPSNGPIDLICESLQEQGATISMCIHPIVKLT